MLKTLIKGTFILTFTSIITRLIGFIYKIYLSNILEPEILGIYQLVFPVFTICYTIFGAGIQTSVSQMIAEKKENKEYHLNVYIKSTLLSIVLALLCSFFLFLFSDDIAVFLLGEIRCSSLLKMLSFSFIPCAIASCINGIYYGLQKTSVPAVTGVIEQIAKVSFVYIMVFLLNPADMETIAIYAVAGIAVGEAVSMVYSIIMILRLFKKNAAGHNKNNFIVLKPLLKLSVPLSSNKLIVALLHSIETILIPIMLKKHGMNDTDALSVYAILTGMALPFIMFPGAITSSMAVLLIPAISEIQSNPAKLKKASSLCIWATLILGSLSTVFFLMIGGEIGTILFNNAEVGIYIEVLSFLCPFIFVSTTLTSIINGLGKTHITFFITIISLVIRIFLTIKLVPAKGISGYVISLLISQIFVTLLSYRYYKTDLIKPKHT